MKVLRCINPECQKEIKYREPLFVLPYRDYVYCSTACFANHMSLYEIEEDDPETHDEYNAWWGENAGIEE